MFFESDYITFDKDIHTVTIADTTQTLPVVVLDTEHKSVKRAAGDLQNDIERVTGHKPAFNTERLNTPSIIVGTVDNDDLLNTLDVDVEELKGKWESFLIQTLILPDQSEPSILILGSDNRGAIYGVYDLTEKIGVSPWHWWMDVPVKTHDALYLKEGRIVKGEPSVEYRGFFLNDEGPSLMTWVRSHFPDFTHEFYEKIFELTLRLKANYHWPAMWDSTFYEDDEKNIETADLYGVVIGTSHHEPMNRPHGDWKAHKKGPWDYATNKDYLQEFWAQGIERSKPFETIINLGMRGDGDEPMGGDLSFQEKIELMETIIADQRQIIQETMDSPVEAVPQMWALYKEVKEYYDSGMAIPDDVTLLWGDDNFGNIRRLPTSKERSRTGGAGIYYHFDYVGGPRSYKWVNTVPIQKTYEQMQKAYAYDAKKLWIVNVGDLKPMEFQTEFFLRLAWDVNAFTPDNLDIYSKEWADYTFGEEYGDDIAQVIRDYVKFNGRIKPEVNNLVEQYSWENEYEAERILEEFSASIDLAESIMNRLPDNLKDVFYQVGYYPAKASFTVLKLQLMANLSKLYKSEGRVAANSAALEAKRLFEEDKLLTFEYNKRISNGKWDHMMDQLHIGYTYWQQPDELIMPEVATLSRDDMLEEEFGVKVVGSDQTDYYTKTPLTVDIYNKGLRSVDIKVVSDKEWADVECSAFILSVQRRLQIKIDWEKAPKGIADVKITFIGSDYQTESVTFSVDNPEVPLSGGYIPIDGKIAIEAEDFTGKQETKDHKWTVLPDYGLTQSSMAIYPVNGQHDYTLEESPKLSYDIMLPESSDIEVIIVTAPSLPFDPDRGMRLGLSIDELKPEILHPGDLTQNGEHDSPDWQKSVIYNCHHYRKAFKQVEAGEHTLHVTLADPQVVIQKIIIDCGGLKPTYLGPQATPHADYLENYSVTLPASLQDYSFVPGELITRIGYVTTSGFYTFVSETKEKSTLTIDGEPTDSSDLIYLTTGYHDFEVSPETGSYKMVLEKESSLAAVSRIHRGKADEIIVDLMLHNQGESAIEYKLTVSLLSENRQIFIAASRGTLKSDEQRLVNFVKDIDPASLPERLTIELEYEGNTRTISQPLNSFN
ncbi:glycosyl hydrolase 115 family protein [Alkalibacterium olivapovliticus]|uniref:Glycosyl hydrolase family 67 n=1 Tax=Alkalibacterium olivapovliticus TaxID=99907 RepID=A0A2T0W686_9LACT|nr:glycosyl hydrolase 115 family protein [Alkalibacterium olivapovliticus]PRY82230.1 glycosyl hydrolase family 67 [Alkalibacterium olivapovliticus]